MDDNLPKLPDGKPQRGEILQELRFAFADCLFRGNQTS
jgi:hypothetical protein